MVIPSRLIRPTLLFTLTLLLLQLIGCTAVTNATHDKPITPDPSKRTFGTYIDDERLETIAKVNLNKTSEALQQSNIKVTVYNGVALLTGRIANQDLRRQAGDVVRQLERIRQVHNELEVRDKKSIWMGMGDSWIKTKVNSKLIADKQVKNSRVKVIVDNGSVFLMGMMNRSQADRISHIAANTKRVVRVVRVIEYLD